MKLLLVFAFATCAFAGPINRTTCENVHIQGNLAFPGQFPYQVSVKHYGQHICGGSVIDQHTILSAAHCINGEPSESLTIMGDCLHVDKGGDSYAVLRYIIHEEYNPATITDDIAVIKVTTIIEFTLYVRPIFLDNRLMQAGIKAIFTGWGNSSQPGAVFNDLLFIRGVVIDLEECKDKLAPLNYKLSNKTLCAVSNYNRGHCLADSGGPLVHNQKQIGISSWLSECGMGQPDIYSRVSYYYNWIKAHQINSN